MQRSLVSFLFSGIRSVSLKCGILNINDWSSLASHKIIDWSSLARTPFKILSFNQSSNRLPFKKKKKKNKATWEQLTSQTTFMIKLTNYNVQSSTNLQSQNTGVATNSLLLTEWSIRMFQNRERKMPLTQTLILIHINKFKVNIIILRSSLLQ